MTIPFARAARLSLCALWGLATAGAAVGETPTEPIRLTIYPAAEPDVPFRYTLLPEYTDQIKANAAVYLGKVTAEESVFFNNKEIWDNIDRWGDASLEELRKENARLPITDTYIHEAARCTYCDWQLPLGREPYAMILLPEIQQQRQFVRMMAAAARIHIANGEYDEALRLLKSSLAHGRHVAAGGETYVNGLVGVATSHTVHEQLMELVQQPDAPNLYWALARLPRPVIDLRNAIDVEVKMLKLSLLGVDRLERQVVTRDEARELMIQYVNLARYLDDSGNYYPITDRSKAVEDAVDELVERTFVSAKATLAASDEFGESLDTMPKEQIVLLQVLRDFDRATRQASKAFFVDCPRAQQLLAAEIQRLEESVDQTGYAVKVNQNSVVAIRAARLAIAKNNRRFALLRLIEALRIYGASHDGQLPEKLEDISEVPVPDDSVTARPFDYQLDGGKATIRSPESELIPALHYEITMKHRLQ